MDITKGCYKKYFADVREVGYRLNAVPMIGDISSELTITFPKPFFMVGMALITDTGGSPPYTNGSVSFDSLNAQGANIEMIRQLAIAFALSNLNSSDESSTVYSGDYYRYFETYLNDDLKPINYNSFLFALSGVNVFWLNQIVKYPDANPRIIDTYEFLEHTQRNTDKRLWLPPGTYTVRAQDGVYKFWDRCFQWQAPVGGCLKVIGNWFNPPTIPLNASTQSFFAVVGDGGGPVLSGSLTVPYAGAGPANPTWPADPTDAAAVTTAIFNWIVAVVTAETGDAPQPFTNYPATLTKWTAAITNDPVDPFCFGGVGAGIQVSFAAADAYNFGTLGLAAGGKGVMALFKFPYAKQPYWDDLAAFVANNDANPIFAVMEQITNG